MSTVNHQTSQPIVSVKLSKMPVSLDRDSDSFNDLYVENETATASTAINYNHRDPDPNSAKPNRNKLTLNDDLLDRDPNTNTSSAELSNSVHSVEATFLMIAQNRRAYITISVLCFINLINYMDRFTIAGVLPKVRDYYGITYTECGLLQTSFIISYMIMAPVFGYLGDRYNRKHIMTVGILFWCTTTFLGSFIPSQYFGAFMFLRALVGTGEASYSTIAPTIIADLFTDSMRSKMLAFFYFAIPVGSGMGYIIGSEVASLLNDWRWAMRVTPVLGIAALCLIIFVVREPPRGESEGGANMKASTVKEDLISLAKNKSFIFSTGGSTCVAFAIGALAWWAPTYMADAIKVQGTDANTEQVGVKFGVITCIAGIAGVLFGSGGAQFFSKYSKQADPLVCAFGVLASVPLLFMGCVIAHKYIQLSWTLIFFGQMFLSFNWAIVADMLLYVIVPTRRSMAEAIQILTSHALGDAFSPYIIGAISDSFMKGKPETAINTYLSLQYALYITAFVLVAGCVFFLLTSVYIERDRALCKKIMKNADGDNDSVHSAQSLPNPVAGSGRYEDTFEDNDAWSYPDTEHLVQC